MMASGRGDVPTAWIVCGGAGPGFRADVSGVYGVEALNQDAQGHPHAVRRLASSGRPPQPGRPIRRG